MPPQDFILRKVIKHLIFPLAASLLFILSNMYWIANDTRGFSSEDTVLLSVAGRAYHNYLNGNFDLGRDLLSPSYPPLIPSLVFLFYILFSPSDKIHLFVNLLFAPLFFFSVYFAGRYYSNSAGKLSLAVFLSLPIVFILSRVMYEQFVLLSLYALSIALLLRTDYFSDRKYSLLYGAAFGLCILARHTSLPALLSFLAGYIFVGIKQQGRRDWKNRLILFFKRRRIKNIFFLFIIIFILAGPWYILNFGGLYDYYLKNSLAGAGNPGNGPEQAFARLKCYFIYIPFEITGFFNFSVLFFFFALAAYHLFFESNGTRKIKREKDSFFDNTVPLVASTLFPVFFISGFTHFAFPQMAPLSVTLALFLGLAFLHLKKYARAALIAWVLIQAVFLLYPITYGSATYSFVYHGLSLQTDSMNSVCPYFIPKAGVLSNNNGYMNPQDNLLAISKENYMQEQIYKDIENISGKEDIGDILFVSSTAYVNPQVFHHYSLLQGKKIRNDTHIAQFSLSMDQDKNRLQREDYQERIRQMEFIILPSNLLVQQSAPFMPEYQYEQEIRSFIEYFNSGDFKKDFGFVKEYNLPYPENGFPLSFEGGNVSLYKRIRWKEQ